MTEPSLVADVQSTRQPWTGASLFDSAQGLVDSIKSEGWVDPLLAGAGLAVEAVATVLDPFSALLSNGLGWAMEYFAPLREALDALAGAPDVVTSHARTWDNMGTHLQQMAGDLANFVNRDLPDWHGLASEAYQALAVHNVNAIGGLASVSAAMAAATDAAGRLVAFTRDIVRDLIADLVARVIVWAVEAIFVVTIPVIAAQIVAAVVKWAGRILTYTTALITSLQNLSKLILG
jgi:uncharacterized protein YukE